MLFKGKIYRIILYNKERKKSDFIRKMRKKLVELVQNWLHYTYNVTIFFFVTFSFSRAYTPF